MRSPAHRLLAPFLLVPFLACASERGRAPSATESTAIADSLRTLVREAYDLTRQDVVGSMLSLYPDDGRVVSATAGRTTTSRDSLGMAVRAFWDGVGRFMVRPDWTWGEMHVDVLDADHAVMTAEYTVPHWTDRGDPHVIGGVWTSVWSNRGGSWRIVHEHLSDLPRALAERIEATMPIADSLATDSDSTGAAHAH